MPNLFRWVSVWVIKMLQYERIGVSEGIDIDKTDTSQVCMLCPDWFYKELGYKFEPNAYHQCHNVLMIAYELKKTLQYWI